MLGNSLYDEKTLLVEIATGDEQAFRKLFNLYKDRFYWVALAEDILQDVFMNIWIKRERLLHVDNPSYYFFTGKNSITVSPWMMLPGQQKIVARRIQEELSKAFV